MHNIKAQRTLIAFIKREAPKEWRVMRAELKQEFAILMDAMPDRACRAYIGSVYAQRKAALVIATARYLSTHRL